MPGTDMPSSRTRVLLLHLTGGGAGAGIGGLLAAQSAAATTSSCCDDCGGWHAPALQLLPPVASAGASGSSMNAADRAAYQRGVDMADEAGAAAPAPASHEVRVQSHVGIKMRDGVTLYADLYLPAAPGRYPTVVNRTPYNHEHMKPDYLKWAGWGYATLEL